MCAVHIEEFTSTTITSEIGTTSIEHRAHSTINLFSLFLSIYFVSHFSSIFFLFPSIYKPFCIQLFPSILSAPFLYLFLLLDEWLYCFLRSMVEWGRNEAEIVDRTGGISDLFSFCFHSSSILDLLVASILNHYSVTIILHFILSDLNGWMEIPKCTPTLWHRFHRLLSLREIAEASFYNISPYRCVCVNGPSFMSSVSFNVNAIFNCEQFLLYSNLNVSVWCDGIDDDNIIPFSLSLQHYPESVIVHSIPHRPSAESIIIVCNLFPLSFLVSSLLILSLRMRFCSPFLCEVTLTMW